MANPRKEILATGQTYHIFNRSIAKEEIFGGLRELNKAIDLCNFYRFKQKISFSQYNNLTTEVKKHYDSQQNTYAPVVDIHSFAFMPNHLHFLITQTGENGIRLFISNLQNAYAKYFNLRYKRTGGLFSSPFKSKIITSVEELTHVSRYIHLNPVTSFLIEVKNLVKYPYTSFPEYFHKKNSFVTTNKILSHFKKPEDYYSFVFDQTDYQRRLHEIIHLSHDAEAT